MQVPASDLRVEQPPNYFRDVLARRNLPGKFRHFVIQKAVIHAIGYFALQNFFEFLEVEHHARRRVRFSSHSHLENVVVSVTVRIVALPEDAPVLLGRKRRIMVEMRRRKLDLACQINHGANKKRQLKERITNELSESKICTSHASRFAPAQGSP